MSPQQRKALHKVLRQFANEMNDAGYDFAVEVKVPISFTMENLKAGFLKPFMRALFPELKSTEELSTSQLNIVYDHFNSYMAIQYGLSFPFPHEAEKV